MHGVNEDDIVPPVGISINLLMGEESAENVVDVEEKKDPVSMADLVVYNLEKGVQVLSKADLSRVV